MSNDALKDATPLKPNDLPKQLVDRQTEVKKLQNLVKGNALIHGPKGTGKTHVTHLSLEETGVNRCYVPCSQYNTQYKALKQIYNNLNKENIGDGYHTSDLQRKVTDTLQSIETVIVLDEIDYLLLNDGDDLLYFLSRVKNTEQLGIVLISSNLSDIQNEIEERTYSSLQPHRIGFEPYDAEHTYRILVERARLALKDQSIQRKALTYIASTTQNISIGLQWLKHAAETTSSIITESHVETVKQRAFTKYAGTQLSQFSEHHQLLYQAINELHQEAEDIQSGTIYQRYTQLCQTYQENTLSQRRVSDYLKHLELLNLIHAEYHYGGQHGKTRKIKIRTI